MWKKGAVIRNKRVRGNEVRLYIVKHMIINQIIILKKPVLRTSYKIANAPCEDSDCLVSGHAILLVGNALPKLLVGNALPKLCFSIILEINNHNIK